MSVIVGIKYNKGIVIGADSQSTAGGKKLEDAIKIKKTKYSNCCVGTCGYTRDGNILITKDELMEYKDILEKKEIDFNYIVNIVVPNIFKILRDNHRIALIDNIENSKSKFIYCTSKKMFKIWCDGAVTEHNDFITLGCGEDLVEGFLNTLNLENINLEEAKEIIKTAIKQSCKDDIYINDKITWVVLEEEKNG